jgi:hypothetical protein
LLQATSSFLIGGSGGVAAPQDLAILRVITEMVDRAANDFMDAHEALERDIERNGVTIGTMDGELQHLSRHLKRRPSVK